MTGHLSDPTCDWDVIKSVRARQILDQLDPNLITDSEKAAFILHTIESQTPSHQHGYDSSQVTKADMEASDDEDQSEDDQPEMSTQGQRRSLVFANEINPALLVQLMETFLPNTKSCTVMDPFAGTGTLGLASLHFGSGMKTVLIDCNRCTVELSKQRVAEKLQKAQEGLHAKNAKRTNVDNSSLIRLLDNNASPQEFARSNTAYDGFSDKIRFRGATVRQPL